jgi:hypothetical protein
MKLKLLRRRLTISAPRMAVRSALPWPLRWLLLSVVLGFSAATMLWAYEFGRSIAGLDRNLEGEVVQLRQELEGLRTELAKAQQVANTSGSLLTAEKAAQDQLMLQIRQLQSDNQALRTDLGFFERLIPGTGSDALTLRGLQVERLSAGELKWQVLVMQAAKNAPAFEGSLGVTFSGILEGKPWSMAQAPESQPVQVKTYLRQEGVVLVPPAAVVTTVTARIWQGNTVKSMQTLKLPLP